MTDFGQIRVINKHLDRLTVEGGIRVYIGRPSILGNPFPIKPGANRAQVIEKYREWLRERLDCGDAAVTGELKRLKEISRSTQVELACYCAPAACHGDVIAETLRGMP